MRAVKLRDVRIGEIPRIAEVTDADCMRYVVAQQDLVTVRINRREIVFLIQREDGCRDYRTVPWESNVYLTEPKVTP